MDPRGNNGWCSIVSTIVIFLRNDVHVLDVSCTTGSAVNKRAILSILLPSLRDDTIERIPPLHRYALLEGGALLSIFNAEHTPAAKAKTCTVWFVILSRRRPEFFQPFVDIVAAAVLSSTMPLFMANFGNTLDGLGEVPADGEAESVADAVKDFIVYFVVIGAVSGISGFAMVSLWSIAGERQVCVCVCVCVCVSSSLTWIDRSHRLTNENTMSVLAG